MEKTMGAPIPKEAVRLPTFQEREGSVPPSEIKRLGLDWQAAVDLVWQVNRPLVDRDYATNDQIISDLKTSKGEDYTPTTEEIEDIIKTRKQEQQAARETDPDKILDDDPAVIANATQIVKEDGSLKDRSLDDPDVLKEAKKREAERRKSLISASDKLYAAEDEVKEIKEAAEKAVKEAFEKEKKDRLDALTAAARAKDKDAPEVTTLPEEDEAELQKKRAEIRKTIIPQYYDKELGIYYRLNEEGKPDKNNPLSTPQAYKPIYEEMQRIAGLKNETGQLTEEALEAQKLLDTLIYNEDKNAFRVLTAEEIKENEIKEDEELVVETYHDLVAKEAEDVIAKYPDIFVREGDDTNGEITGVNQKKLKEVLKDLEPNAEMGHRLLLLAAYYDRGISLEQKGNIVALIYHELEKTNKDALKGLKHKQVLTDRLEEIRNILVTKYQIPPEQAIGLEFDHLLRDLALALVCEDKLTIDQEARKYLLPKKAQELLDGWHATTTEKKIIIKLASEKGAASFMANVFGIDARILTDNNAMGEYAQKAIDVIKERLPNEHIQKVYQEVLSHHLSDESLSKIAEKRGFPRGLGYGLMLLFIFAPSIQGLLGTGLLEEEKPSSSRH